MARTAGTRSRGKWFVDIASFVGQGWESSRAVLENRICSRITSWKNGLRGCLHIGFRYRCVNPCEYVRMHCGYRQDYH